MQEEENTEENAAEQESNQLTTVIVKYMVDLLDEDVRQKYDIKK